MIKYQIVKKSLELFPILNLSKTIKCPSSLGQPITNFKQFTFPGGEEHIRIESDDFDLVQSADNMMIIGDTTSSQGLIKTILATDAIRSINSNIKIRLFVPYFPYARQDRRMVSGEPFSVKVISNLINQQNYDTVEIFDPHSDVVTALINNLSVIPNTPFVHYCYNKIQNKYKKSDTVIVSPDAGAEKKVYKAVGSFGNSAQQILCCTKQRDVLSGRIMSSTVPDVVDIKNKHCIILDDIIDGGGTFIELSQKLKEKGAKTVDCIISHGIYSKGFEELKKSINHIYTSDSFSYYENNDFVTTIPLLDILHYNDWYCTGKTREPFSIRFIENNPKFI